MGSYKFDVPVPGLYQVELRFAELTKFSSGSRVFRVNLEGSTVLDSFDIYQQSPFPYHHMALTRSMQVQVNDGTLNIDFYNITDNPTVNGIYVMALLPATATPTLSPTPSRTSTVTLTPTVTNTPVGPTSTPTTTPSPTVAPGCPDIYEPDDATQQSRSIAVGAGPQHHNFNIPFDVDWISFNGTAGSTYTIWTSQLAGGVDTVIALHDPQLVWIATNDDDGSLGGGASRLIYRTPVDGTYYVRTNDYQTGSRFGCATGYDIQVDLGAPTPVATATGTVTRTPTRTSTATSTPVSSWTPTVSPTSTATVAATGSATATATSTPTSLVTPTVTRTGTATSSPTITRTPTATPVGVQIGCNMTFNGDTRGESNRFIVYPCGGGSETGPERVYYLSLSGTATVRARILSYQQSGVGNPDVFLLSRFDSNACVAGGWGDGSSPSSWATYTDAPGGIVYVVVDGWQGWAEQFTLQVECSGPGVPTSTQTPGISRPYGVSLPIVLNEFYQ